jgi:hypothetical protein
MEHAVSSIIHPRQELPQGLRLSFYLLTTGFPMTLVVSSLRTYLRPNSDVFEAASLNPTSIPLNGLPRLQAPVKFSRPSTKLYRRSAGDASQDFESGNGRGSDKLGDLLQNMEKITNPAKRRKTVHGGVLPAEPFVTGTPAIRPGDVPRASATVGFGQVLTRRTIITGESRAQASGQPSRISTNGAVQKMRSTEAQAIDYVLRRQVFPYITSSAKRYSKCIREADRTAMVTKVSSEED